MRSMLLLLLMAAYSMWANCSIARLAAAASAPCNYSAQICGDLAVPYPFGMSSECGLPAYRISCKSAYGAAKMPFLQVGTAFTAELQVLSFSDTSITVNSTELKAMPPSAKDCNFVLDAVAVLELPQGGPFVLSDGNIFVVIGCNSRGSCVASAVNSTSDERFSIECSSGCYNQDDFEFCNKYACCSNFIPSGSRYLNFTGNGITYEQFPGVCGFSTVLKPSTYSNPERYGVIGAGQYGLSIAWALILGDSENCSTARNRLDYACSEYADCVYYAKVPGYTCNCSKDGFRGDGYINGLGCEDIDECKEGLDDCDPPPLGICTNTVGSYNCSCAVGSTGSGTLGTCVVDAGKTDVVFWTVLGALAGAFSLGVLAIILFVSRRAYRRKQQRQENFHRNRGAELRSILFSEDELKRITNNFSHEHELGKGGYGTVYWGKLANNGKVAIKKAKHMGDEEREEQQMKSFVSEILLLGKTTHENVVRLLGCCVETRVPLLVYEFVENGTLWDHLHVNRSEQISSSLLSGSWARRLDIAVGTAKAVSYLHKMSPPILHRDIKSTNILIDKSYNPKVADFGASRFLTSGATHLTFALVEGTRGYLDPEYHRSCQFTDKSDVYSFGVVLLELITAMPADLGTQLGLLAHHFQTKFRTKSHTDLIDCRLALNSEILASIEDVAQLAVGCLAMEGYQRPTMEEVLRKLHRIHSKRASLVLQDHEMPRSGTASAEQTNTSAGDSDERSLLSSRRNGQYTEIEVTSSSEWP